MTTKVRVNFDLTGRALAEADELQELLDCSSRADAFRQGIRIALMIARTQGEGHRIFGNKGDEIKELVFPAIPLPPKEDHLVEVDTGKTEH